MDDDMLKKRLHQAALNSVYGLAAVGSKHFTDMVVMSPTVQRAVRELEAFKSSKWSMLIKKIDWIRRYVDLLGGHRIYFKGETEGKEALMGIHANVVSIDDFLNITDKEVTKE